MMTSPDNIDLIFWEALQLASEEERRAYLERACGADHELRRLVEKLLRAEPKAAAFLEQSLAESHAPAVTVDDPPLSEVPGTVIGPYKLLEQIGEGGMGSVWMAEQTEPIRRRVALKVVKEGMDSRQVLARFDAERQALALMEHPNIAKVLDAGRTPSGRPYFVMELVKGKPITNYCDEQRLGVRERLDLFGEVCRAVQHAHQKGIIHRDIKPSNVLVAPYDGKPVVKVIDFGVAKATGQRLTDKTLFTGFGALVGTPEYMSPEQAEVNNQDIDTRSDIYSLGVLLYELLTGSTPLTRKRLQEAPILEVLRVIREEEPPRPSTRLAESKETLPSISAQRQTEPAKLTKLVRGELDWIAMKALEKDRNRRYETANGFAMDVQRYLADEPVQACPPSASYRLRKFVRRNKGALLAVAVVLLAVVGGIVGTTWQLLRAERAVAAEKTANEMTNKRLTQVEKGNEILASIFADVEVDEVREGDQPLEAVLAQRLVQAADQLEGESVGEPLAVAALQERLGKSLMSLGFADRAIPILQKCRQTLLETLGGDHPATLSTTGNLAQCYQDTGKLDLALSLFEQTLPLIKDRLGPDHPDTLGCMNGLGVTYFLAEKLDLALPLLEETLRLRKARFGPDDLFTLSSMNSLAVAYEDAGRFEQSLPLKKEVVRLEKTRFGPDHPKTISGMNNLAAGYGAAGQVDLALRLFEETFALAKARLGPYHPQTLLVMNNLGLHYHHAGKRDLACPLLEEAYRLMKVKLGRDHFNTLACMQNLADCYRKMKKFNLALPLYEEVLERTKAKFGAVNRRTLNIMNDLAQGYQAAGKPDLALSLLVEILELTKDKLGANHPYTLISMNNLANGYYRAGKLDLALPLHEEVYQRMKLQFGPDHIHTVTCRHGLATCYRTVGKLDLALPLYEELHNLNKARFGPVDPRTLKAKEDLLGGYIQAGKTIQAAAIAKELLSDARRALPPDSPVLAAKLAQIGLHFLTIKAYADAEQILRDCLAIRAKAQPDHWTTFNTQSLLGAALLGQQKYAAAEPLLLAGYKGMKEREKTIPPVAQASLPEAADRLVALYTAKDKPDEMKKWQAERATYPKANRASLPQKK
jgi:serine/threonine protein kinase/tetratricopeptide (TPR) repeat protein